MKERYLASHGTGLPTHPGIYALPSLPGYTSLPPLLATVQAPRHSSDGYTALEHEVAYRTVSDGAVTVARVTTLSPPVSLLASSCRSCLIPR